VDERRVQGTSILLATDDSGAARAGERSVTALARAGPYRADVASVAGAGLALADQAARRSGGTVLVVPAG